MIPRGNIISETYREYLEWRELEPLLHAAGLHPDYEYVTTQGGRKCWYDSDVPPGEAGSGWERNTHMGRDGWERFDYHEESYWMRRKGGG